jgi:hypothetical protein
MPLSQPASETVASRRFQPLGSAVEVSAADPACLKSGLARAGRGVDDVDRTG